MSQAIQPDRPAMPPGKVLYSVDWDLLRDQKETLTNLLARYEGRAVPLDPETTAQHLQGLLNLLDDIQDSAAQMGLPAYTSLCQVVFTRQVGKANHPES